MEKFYMLSEEDIKNIIKEKTFNKNDFINKLIFSAYTIEDLIEKTKEDIIFYENDDKEKVLNLIDKLLNKNKIKFYSLISNCNLDKYSSSEVWQEAINNLLFELDYIEKEMEEKNEN